MNAIKPIDVLKRYYIGKTFIGTTAYNPQCNCNEYINTLPSVVKDVRVVGKSIVFDLENGESHEILATPMFEINDESNFSIGPSFDEVLTNEQIIRKLYRGR